MATLTVVHRGPDVGQRQQILADYTGPASYVNPGGDPVLASELPFRVGTLDLIETDDSNANSYRWDATLGAIKAYVKTTGVEVANGVDLSGDTIRIKAHGR